LDKNDNSRTKRKLRPSSQPQDGAPRHGKDVAATPAELAEAALLHRTQDALQRSEAKYRDLIEHASDGIFVTNGEHDFILANSTFCDMLGYRSDELLGLNVAATYADEERDLLATRQQTLQAANTLLVERMMRRKDGTCFPAEISVRGLADGNFQGIVRDTTERRQAAEEQRQSRQLLDNIVENIPISVQLRSIRDGHRLVIWNKATETMYGVPREQALGSTIHELWQQPLADQMLASDLELIRRRGMEVFPDRAAPHSSGATIRLHMRKAVLLDSDGEPTHLLIIADDITAHKAAEARLRDSEARFRSLTELSSDWYWEQDEYYRFVTTGLETVDQTGERIGTARWDDADAEVTPSQWATHRAVLDARGLFRDFEYDRRTTGGARRTIAVSGAPFFDEAGKFRGYRGIGRDVTARKQSEQALRASEERFANAFEHAPIGMALVAPDGTFLKVNRSLCVLLGYSPEQLATKTFQQITHPDDLAADLALLQRLLSGEVSSYNIEKRYFGAQDRVLWVLLGVTILRDANGEPLHVIAQIQDITERKRAEQDVQLRAVQQSLIADFGQAALENTDLDELLDKAAEVAARGLNAGFSKLLQLAGDGRSLTLKAGIGWPGECKGQCIADLGDADNDRLAIALRQPVVVDDFTAEARFAHSALLRAHDIRSAIQVPIHGPKAAFGVLGVYTREQRHFTQDNVAFLQSVANTLATAMDRRGAEQRLSYMAQFDSLTGLPNRSLFVDRFGQTLRQSARNRWRVGVLFVDLDRFKNVNDTLGHDAGDQLLVEAARRLQLCVRAGDTVARLGGDEFAFVLTNLTHAHDAGLVATKVVAAMAQPFQLSGQQVYVSASIGIGIFPDDGTDPDVLLRNADTAMYRAKEGGRNNYQFYLPQMNERAAERLHTETQLRGALERDEFLLHYQPKVDLRTQRISGIEALVRWRHPQLGEVSPARFIPLAEETGLIIAIGEWVLDDACRQHRRWLASGLVDCRMAVNVSAVQFQRHDFADIVAVVLERSGLPPNRLELELTESVMMDRSSQAGETFGRLRDLGVLVSIDDFGTGFSSLSYLKRFPVDKIKIDRSFIDDITRRTDDAAITLSIIAIAHHLGLGVIAEGVETPEQLEFLRQHQCDEAQGYLISKPLPAEKFEQFVAAYQPLWRED
jgi:diguanylate cyclase (GGDEF)-like protein/PAS domain S-box-containing protein